MIEQDYILKILQEFFEAIAKVVRRSDEDDEAATADMQARYNAIYEQFFRCPAHHFYEIEKEDLLNDLWTENSEQKALAKMRMLSELLYRDALIKKEGSLRYDLLEKALLLLEFLQQNSKTYSWDQENKMAYIRTLLEEYG
ncbi:hypothetical protein TFKS16_1274 [Tannerella forsythia KS16]|jgi:hypothetical protein|uniref:Uncharacterized protein n=1 Tax=Tannerella forsythia TaxID=28112 RepID=A0A2A6E6L8_TANFO|nr:hypothetical protein [Tannerella forsythia]KKY60486.1 hypothetical protein Tanf_12155 [Tannerella forsythia]OLQ20881.1 hypothetical protein BGK60_05555 [Tannerella forsythia]PDP43178.1 hypothetical protein CLI86_09750 [Tannerella forsythia]TPE17756.1 hypothetical protein FJN16_04135 [Tannerella forsythia]SCQ19231.1 hypothetical protein TFUB4_00733 [Tannerella forsythia]